MSKNKLFWRMNIINNNFKNKQNILCLDCKKVISGNAYLYHGMLHCENCSKEYIKEINKS